MRFQGKCSNSFNYIDANYKFRFNVVTGLYEFKSKSKKDDWKKYTDRHKNSLLLELMRESVDLAVDKLNIFIESEDFAVDYNPFEEYFEGLKPHKKKDHIKELSKTIETDSPERFHKTLERFLVGTIDCLLNEDRVNDVCLVFQGAQGTGKSRWMRRLLPKKFRNEFLYEGEIDTKNKDHVMYLSQYWFIHLDELESLRSNDIGAIKSYITRQRISLRKAFGRYKINLVRRASFLGSVNQDKFLSDTTGNRRWLVFKVKNIDYTHNINPDKIWAQAYHLYKSGYRHWFDTEEIKQVNSENEKFRTMSLEEELLLRYFKFNESKGDGELLSGSEVIEKVIVNVPNFSHKMRAAVMGKALAKHSLHKKYKNGLQRYYVDYFGTEIETQSPAIKKEPINKEIKDGDDLPF